ATCRTSTPSSMCRAARRAPPPSPGCSPRPDARLRVGRHGRRAPPGKMGNGTDAPGHAEFLPSFARVAAPAAPPRGEQVTMTDTSIELDPIKTKHRAMWALGDYDRVSTDVIPELGTVLAEAAAIKSGERVLDVAAGSGNASLPAAAAGARVTATDLTPELLEI